MSEPSIITREQIDTLRGLLQDVDTSVSDSRHHAMLAIERLLDRVEARPRTVGDLTARDLGRQRVRIDGGWIVKPQSLILDDAGVWVENAMGYSTRFPLDTPVGFLEDEEASHV